MNEFMIEAINLAKKAYTKGEVPIGAVVVKDNKIISKGYNKREKSQNAIAHAEIVAIEKACKKLKSWRLENCDIYVTLEPCFMCAGAILNARIKNLYFGAYEEKSGSATSNFNVFDKSGLNHSVNVQGGICADDSKKLLQDFFAELRIKDKINIKKK